MAIVGRRDGFLWSFPEVGLGNMENNGHRPRPQYPSTNPTLPLTFGGFPAPFSAGLLSSTVSLTLESLFSRLNHICNALRFRSPARCRRFRDLKLRLLSASFSRYLLLLVDCRPRPSHPLSPPPFLPPCALRTFLSLPALTSPFLYSQDIDLVARTRRPTESW